ncbi:MAG TPA: hypothetical protein VLD19_03930, partial [Chitinophagaceae bacterium]|nr:hypothetical protein [Chitinophagaceae bacterium]
MEQMQASLLDLNQAIQHQDINVFKTTLTFRHFIDFLKETAEVAEPVQAALCRATLDRFAEYPELYGTVPVENMVHYQGLLDHVHALLTPTLPAVKQPLWAMSLAATPHMFYGTATFYNLLCTGAGKPKNTLITYSADQWKEKRLTNIYSMILEKLYGFSMTSKPIIHEITDEETGLTTYYRFNFDGRFMRVKSDIELPELSIELLQ